ncbi:hypothetical protein P9112_011506 [Eukaryota sp. TZLM1-RC]
MLLLYRRSGSDPHLYSPLPHFHFPTLSFNVQKRNHYMVTQQRMIILNATGFENIKTTKLGTHKITKTFQYSSIQSITLSSINTFIIYPDCDHSFTYITPEAIQIASELVRRLESIRQSFSLSHFPPPPESSKPSLSVAKQIQSLAPSSVVRVSAHKLSPAEIADLQGKCNEYVLFLIFKSKNMLDKVVGFIEKLPGLVADLNSSNNTSSGQNVTSPGQNGDLSPRRKSIGRRLSIQSKPDDLMTQIRMFLSWLRDSLLFDYRESIIDHVMVNDGQVINYSELSLLLRRLLDNSLQRFVLIEVAEPLFFHIRANKTFELDNSIRNSYTLTKELPLNSFDKNISGKVSHSQLLGILNTLSSLSTPQSYFPFYFIDTIADCCRMISFICSKSSNQYLSADQFLPLLIYCIKEAKIESPGAICELVFQLTDSILLKSEEGYFVTTFNSAIIYLETVDVTGI